MTRTQTRSRSLTAVVQLGRGETLLLWSNLWILPQVPWVSWKGARCPPNLALVKRQRDLVFTSRWHGSGKWPQHPAPARGCSGLGQSRNSPSPPTSLVPPCGRATFRQATCLWQQLVGKPQSAPGTGPAPWSRLPLLRPKPEPPGRLSPVFRGNGVRTVSCPILRRDSARCQG